MNLALTTLPLALSLVQGGAQEPATDSTDRPDAARFSAPVLLMADGDPLGDGRLYPSPRLLDVDGDDDLELVIGDLVGAVTVSERAKEGGTGGWGWSAPAPLSTDGRDLKFHNW